MVTGLDDVDRDLAFMHALPRLKLVQTLNAGFEQWVGRLPPNVALSNARGAHGRATAEWVAAVLLAHYRELNQFAASQVGRRWDTHRTDSLQGKRVSVLGAGDIGANICRMLAPFGCPIMLVGRSRRNEVVTMDDFQSAAAQQDVVVLALPVTPETRGLVDARFLTGMKGRAPFS